MFHLIKKPFLAKELFIHLDLMLVFLSGIVKLYKVELIFKHCMVK